MNRRQFLMGTVPATLALAGCNAGYDGPVRTPPEETPSPTGTASPTATPRPTPEGFWRVVSLEDQGTVADRHQVSMTATVEEPWITAEHTARIAVTLTNHADRDREFYRFVPEVRRGILHEEGVVLGRPHPPTCIGTDGWESGPFGQSPAIPVTDVRAGESVTEVYGIGDDERVRGCIPPGTYRFVWDGCYKAIPKDDPQTANCKPIRWGLTLEVTSPG